jgi:hypothetical protein
VGAVMKIALASLWMVLVSLTLIQPLQAIDNIRKISAVVADGHLLDRGALDRLLAQVESTNKIVQ